MSDPMNQLLRLMSLRVGSDGDDPSAVLEAAREAAALVDDAAALWQSHGAELLACFWSAGTGRVRPRLIPTEGLTYGLFTCPTCEHTWTEAVPPFWFEDGWPGCPLCAEDDPAEVEVWPSEKPRLIAPLERAIG